ncbi:hypothetical protein J1614_011956 [Plenodomus biglobosus]|nr:hypothetical protein J1614_011956 [Plenodomus biglobosus]
MSLDPVEGQVKEANIADKDYEQYKKSFKKYGESLKQSATLTGHLRCNEFRRLYNNTATKLLQME